MKTIFRIIILLVLPLFGFGQQTINGSIIHDGLQRDYILYVPASYSPTTAVPLVFNFHGYTSNAMEQMFYGDFRPIADTAGFIIVHPMGTVDNLGNTHWNVGWGTSTVDDIGFTSDLIDSLLLEYNINQERIFSTGMSNGGFMSYFLACGLSERFAAIASVTGSMNVDQANTCNCSHPMPILEIHGTGDGTVPYEGNFMFAPIESVLLYWALFNNGDAYADYMQMPDLDPNDGSTVERYWYSNGENGSIVDHYKVINGGHTWPGSNFGGAGTNYDIDASTEVWKFFSKYDLNGLIVPTSISQNNNETVKIYPNPSSSIFNIDVKSNKDSYYQITSIDGRLVKTGSINSGNSQINLSHFKNGIYFLKIENKSYKILKSN